MMKTRDFLYYRSLNSGTSGGGGGSDVRENDVNFYDYDGTLLASYSKEQFASLAALPANPTHAGMVAQGWNWTLADAKAAVADFGFLDIGQMYTTESGATEIDIELFSRLEPWTRIAVNGTATIDWGDGSTASTVTGTSSSSYQKVQHIYAALGKYTIKIAVTGKASLGGNSTMSQVLYDDTDTTYRSLTYVNSVLAIRFGANMAIASDVCREMRGLQYVTLSREITAIPFGFAAKSFLPFIVIPDTVTALNSDSLSAARLNACIPKSAVVGGSAFYDSGTRRAVVYANNSTGQFNTDGVLSRIGIHADVPGSFCKSCRTLKTAIIKNATTVGDTAFQNCYSLSYVEIPETVTSIGTNAFGYCYSLKEIHFKCSTPPTLGNAYVFSNVPTDCKIYVPQGSLTAYTTAENYPDSATYTYIEE